MKSPKDAAAARRVLDKRIKLAADVLAAFRVFGSIGGRIGGKSRMSKLTTAERRALARKAAAVRWGKGKRKPKATLQTRPTTPPR
jgi:hypothetical protein